jgi:hypothetical protein
MSEPRRRWRSVALPAQHGSWGLVLEPILLGLLVGGAWPGMLLALAAFGAFLLDQPLRVMWADWRRGRVFGRTRLARRFALAYGLAAVVAGGVFVWRAGWEPLWPLAVAAPLFGIYVYYDWSRPGRFWQAELAAPLAFGATAAALGLAGGGSWELALTLWLAIGARAVPSILFIRARLRLDKGQPVGRLGSLLAHGVALLVMAWPVAAARMSWWGLIPYGLLLGRAAVGVSAWRRPVSVPRLGVAEMGWGGLTILLVAAAIIFA